MISAEDMILAPIPDLQLIHGVQFPKESKFRQFLVTGPPGAGKSTLVAKMRGWPYEVAGRSVEVGAPARGRAHAG